LHFKNNDVHIREVIKYTNYQRFNTSIGKITVITVAVRSRN